MRKAGYPTTEQGITRRDPEMVILRPRGGAGYKVSTSTVREPNQIRDRMVKMMKLGDAMVALSG